MKRSEVFFREALEITDLFAGKAHSPGGSVAEGVRSILALTDMVFITESSIDAFKKHAHPIPLEPNIRPALTAFLRELGFEVAE